MLMNTHEARLDALRKELKTRGLDGFVVPISDEHMSEYVGGYAQRLAWLTGFGGSAGNGGGAGRSRPAIFVDGRYTLQVRDQVDGRLYAYKSVPQTSVAKWLGEHAPRRRADRLRSVAARQALGRGGGQGAGGQGRPSWCRWKRNPIDAVWADRPAPSLAPALVHADELCRPVRAQAKRAEVAEWLSGEELDAAVISALDSVAWLLNIRGSDVERTPVALAFVMVHADGTADLFIAERKGHAGAARASRQCGADPRRARPSSPRWQALAGKKVAVDPERSVAAIFAALEGAGAEVVELTDPPCCPRRSRTRPSRPATAPRRPATARRWRGSCTGCQHRGAQGPVDELSAADEAARVPRRDRRCCATCRSTPSRAPGPTARSSHYRVSEETNRRSSRAASIWSIRAGSIPTAPPTSPAPSGSARRADRRNARTASPAC